MTSPPLDAAAALARRLGVDKPDDGLLDAAGQAIADAEADVEAYLGQPIHPVTKVAAGCWPMPGGWGIPGEHRPLRQIVSVAPELVPGSAVESGMFTITYTVGLDYLADPACRPIARYVTAAALNDYLLLQYVEKRLGMRGPVESVNVSTEGQSKSVTYGHLGFLPPAARANQSSDYPGQLPKLASLDRWRVAGRRVHQAPTAVDPWRRERSDPSGGWYGVEDTVDRAGGGRWWQ